MGTSGGAATGIGGRSAAGQSVTQRFLSSGTYTVPAGATRIEINGISASPGAGSGARGTAAAVPTGGCGGGGGARLTASYPAIDGLAPGSAVTVTIGAPGVGGAAVTTDNTVGNAGTSPGNLSFGNYASTFWVGNPPSGGGFGVSATNTGRCFGTFTADFGKPSNATGIIANNGGGFSVGGVGASSCGGGGITSAGVASNGAQGDIVGGHPVTVRGSAGVVGGPGPGMAALINDLMGGDSAGSGASSVTGAAQAGADGVFPGGGAGGGGASLNGFASGKGGDGAAGFLDVTAHFGD